MTDATGAPLPSLDLVKSGADELILSASGWRKIFARNGEEDTSPELSAEDRIVVGAMALAFSRAIKTGIDTGSRAVVAVATDSRPTGPAIADVIIRVFVSEGIDVCFSGITAVPELLSMVQREDEIGGFAYISASHNPVGHNGLKFGFGDGSVAGGETSAALIASFSEIVENTAPEAIDSAIATADPAIIEAVYAEMEGWKETAYTRYMQSTALIAANTEDPGESRKLIEALKSRSAKKPVGIIADFNGSARAVSIDKQILGEAGCLVETMNHIPGEIAHRIVPEGESLDPCRRALEKLHRSNPAYCLGYVPDNDGDRGNLVYIDNRGEAQVLHAQDVFALSCLSELCFLYSKSSPDDVVVAANGPTSMRVDEIAAYFGARVERAEVGEANVVNLARELRQQGSVVRILGEGAAGGTIIHPATCRDPLNTLFSVLKLLLPWDGGEGPGLFELWCRKSGQENRFNPGFTIQDIVETLPVYTTTSSYEERAIMRITTNEHGVLKERYEGLFEKNWPGLKETLETRNFAVRDYELVNYEGTRTRPGRGNRDKNGAQRGGLKVILKGSENTPAAYLWMRGSGTEPVFRVLVDIKGDRPEMESFLLERHREMIREADNS